MTEFVLRQVPPQTNKILFLISDFPYTVLGMNSKTTNFHEDFSRSLKFKIDSEKKFGLWMSGIFFCLFGFIFLKTNQIQIIFLVLGFLFLLLATIFPLVLKPLQLLLIKLGDVLQKVISPVALGILFFLVFTPIGQLMKFLKKDLLDLSFPNRSRSTYWIENSHYQTNMKDQF